jgi:class 3 adenylate cyclase
MQQIADWLERLGLGQYAQRFAENDIDFEVLSDLTDQDLEKIGVASVGHRRKLLRAIANLKGAEKSTPAVAIAVAPPAMPRAADTAERRQVTVMFSDLVGSTALSARMDPEDLRELISAYQKCAAEAVRRFGGFVARYMGDGMLVCFGYPERAARGRRQDLPRDHSTALRRPPVLVRLPLHEQARPQPPSSARWPPLLVASSLPAGLRLPTRA